MKFRLYAVLHNMKLDNSKSKGKRIEFESYHGRITNNISEFEKILANPEANERIGYHSTTEFTNKKASYVYIDGELEDINTLEEMDKKAGTFTFDLLREVEKWIHYLWAVKDNDIYVRDGFLIAYPNNFNDVATYKASLSTINTIASTERGLYSIYSDEEIEKSFLLKSKELFAFGEDNQERNKSYDPKYPTPEVFYKEEGSTRYIRAFFFTIGARSEGILPLKITSYVNALECLFSTVNTEITYRIAERVALLLKENKEERIDLFYKVKKAYDIRSKINHGDYLKLRNGEESELIEVSILLDNLLRTLLVKHKEFFEEENNQKLEEKFLSLVFENK